jgi:hypothetical protein
VGARRDAQDQIETEEKLAKWRKRLANADRVHANFFGEDERAETHVAGGKGGRQECSSKTVKKAFQEYHLLASVQFRPKGDSFSSTERATVLVASMFMTALAVAFQYGACPLVSYVRWLAVSSSCSRSLFMCLWWWCVAGSENIHVSNWLLIALISAAFGAISSALVLSPLFSRSGEGSVREQFEHEARARNASVFELDSNKNQGCVDTYCCYCCGRRFPRYVKALGYLLSLLWVGACLVVSVYFAVQFSRFPGQGDVVSDRERAWLYCVLLAFGIDWVLLRPLLALWVSLVAWCRAPPSQPAPANINAATPDPHAAVGASIMPRSSLAIEMHAQTAPNANAAPVDPAHNAAGLAALSAGFTLSSDPALLSAAPAPAPAPAGVGAGAGEPALLSAASSDPATRVRPPTFALFLFGPLFCANFVAIDLLRLWWAVTD